MDDNIAKCGMGKKRTDHVSHDQVMSHIVTGEEDQQKTTAGSSTTSTTPASASSRSKASIFSNQISCGIPIERKNVTQSTASSTFGKKLLETLDTLPPINLTSTKRKISSKGTIDSEQSAEKTNSMKKESIPNVSTCSTSHNEPVTNQLEENASTSIVGKVLTVDLTKGSIFQSQPKIGIVLNPSDQKESPLKTNSFRSGLLGSISSIPKSSAFRLVPASYESTSTKPLSEMSTNNPDSKPCSQTAMLKQTAKKTDKFHPYRKKQDVTYASNSNPIKRLHGQALATPLSSSVATDCRPLLSGIGSIQSHARQDLKKEIIDHESPCESSQSLPTEKTSRLFFQSPSVELKRSKPIDAVPTIEHTPSLHTEEWFQPQIRKKCGIVGSPFSGENPTLLAGNLPDRLSHTSSTPRTLGVQCSASVDPHVQPLSKEDKIQPHLRYKSKQSQDTATHDVSTGQEAQSLLRDSQKKQAVNFTSHPLSTEHEMKPTKPVSISSDVHIDVSKVEKPSSVNNKLNHEQLVITVSDVPFQPSSTEQVIQTQSESKLVLIEEKAMVVSPTETSFKVMPRNNVCPQLPKQHLEIKEQTYLPYSECWPSHQSHTRQESLTKVEVNLDSFNEQQLHILNSHPKFAQKVKEIIDVTDVHIMRTGPEDNYLAVISGLPDTVKSAEEHLKYLTYEVRAKTVTKTIRCQYKTIPLFCSHNSLQKLLRFQQENCLDIKITKKDGILASIQDFDSYLKCQGSLKANKLSDFLLQGTLSSSYFCWEALNDTGNFQPVPQQFDQKLKQLSESSNNVEITFDYNGNTYTVNFVAQYLFENHTHNCKYRRLRKGSPYWLVWSINDSRHVRHRYSNDIEQIFQFGGESLSMEGTTYTLCFESSRSFQVDVQTLTETEIQRYPPCPPFLPEFELMIIVTGLMEDVLFVEESIMQLSQLSTNERPFSFVLPSKNVMISTIIQAQLLNVARQYFVGVQPMKMRDNTIGVMLEGAPDCLEHVYALLCKLTFELQQKLFMSLSEDSTTDFWDPQVEKCEVKPVSEVGQEWNSIYELMKETMPDVRIQKIERIQNKPLRKKYSIEPKHMSERNGEKDVNEKRLFHGSGKTDPRDVVLSDKGIDFRYSNRDRKLMWGTGAYFAVNASYSHTYAHPVQDSSNLKEMILARVLTGKSCYSEPNSELTKPPPLPNSSSRLELYDTVKGSTGNSTVYITYDHYKSYPAYIITYYEK